MFNKYKIFLPLIVVFTVIILMIVVALISFLIKPQTSEPIMPSPTVSVKPVIIRKITPVVTKSTVKSDAIVVSGVDIKNIYDKPVEINNSGDVVFFKNENYQYTYLPHFSKFNITILSLPFWEKEKEAEDNFTEVLGITKKDACFLNVEISTPLFVSEEFSCKVFPLTYCADI